MVKVDLTNFVTIALIAFIGVWAINHGLVVAGLSHYKA